MEIISTVAGLREAVAKAKAEGLTVGLVPTMGALHAGHISLIERARKECGFVVVSVFVNPTQFNNQNDLLTYPRTVEADCEKLTEAGVDVAFVPTVEEVYPEPDTRVFDLGPVAEVMEGAMRPGHFDIETLKEMVVTELNAIDGMEVEYYEIVDSVTLQPVETWEDARHDLVGCVTVWLGDVRLIDNIKYPLSK